MIKKRIYLGLALLFAACNSENAGDCLQTSGDLVQQQIATAPFTRILVNEGIEMIISEGPVHEVTIETGENLLNEIEVRVEGNELVLSNNNNCNLFRNYDPARLYVSAPNVTEIRSSTQFNIRSEGVLTWPQLHIISEDYSGDFANVGEFYLNVANDSFEVTCNNLSNCFIEGTTNNLTIGFYAGNSRFEGANFIAAEVTVFHRSSNDIVVHPTDVLQGDIYSTGDVIAVNEPPVVSVTEHYKGNLIFEN